jgi:hypothetical protein
MDVSSQGLEHFLAWSNTQLSELATKMVEISKKLDEVNYVEFVKIKRDGIVLATNKIETLERYITSGTFEKPASTALYAQGDKFLSLTFLFLGEARMTKDRLEVFQSMLLLFTELKQRI